MEKILFIKYTPRNEWSKSKQLFDFTYDLVKERYEVEILDLEDNLPEFFTNTSVISYIKRNFIGEEITTEQKESLKKYDLYLEKFLSADKIVFIYPMYNFSMPGAVKTFIDMVIQKGKAFDITQQGYIGLCSDKEIIGISTAGGFYTEEFNTKNLDHNLTLLGNISGLIGAKFTPIFVQGLDMSDDSVSLVEKAKQEIKDLF